MCFRRRADKKIHEFIEAQNKEQKEVNIKKVLARIRLQKAQDELEKAQVAVRQAEEELALAEKALQEYRERRAVQ